MKFDVVVGNPPYQEPNRRNKPLWPRFVALASDLIKEDGIVGFITPPSWIGKNSNKADTYDVFQDNHISYVKMYDLTTNPFRMQASTEVCWYLLKRGQGTTELCQMLSSGESVMTCDLNAARFMPSILTPLTVSINTKLSNSASLPLTNTSELHSQQMKKKQQISDTKVDEFVYPYHVSHRITRYSSTPFAKDDMDCWRVMIPKSSTIDNSFIDYNCVCSEDIFYINVDSQQEAEQLLAILKSHLFVYIGKMYRGGRNLTNMLRSGCPPYVDINRSWTDTELYEHFDLTDEEIALIEETIK